MSSKCSTSSLQFSEHLEHPHFCAPGGFLGAASRAASCAASKERRGTRYVKTLEGKFDFEPEAVVPGQEFTRTSHGVGLLADAPAGLKTAPSPVFILFGAAPLRPWRRDVSRDPTAGSRRLTASAHGMAKQSAESYFGGASGAALHTIEEEETRRTATNSTLLGFAMSLSRV